MNLDTYGLKIIARYESTQFSDVELVDVLRAISMYDGEFVTGRRWYVGEIEVCTFGPRQGLNYFNQVIAEDKNFAIVSGEHFFERSALLHQFHAGHFLRIVDAGLPVEVDAEYRLCGGPAAFQASNVDFEIRTAEYGPYEIVTTERNLVSHLQDSFRITERLPDAALRDDDKQSAAPKPTPPFP